MSTKEKTNVPKCMIAVEENGIKVYHVHDTQRGQTYDLWFTLNPNEVYKDLTFDSGDCFYAGDLPLQYIEKDCPKRWIQRAIKSGYDFENLKKPKQCYDFDNYCRNCNSALYKSTITVPRLTHAHLAQKRAEAFGSWSGAPCPECNCLEIKATQIGQAYDDDTSINENDLPF